MVGVLSTTEAPMTKERTSFQEIEFRHGRDRWRDAVFIAAALLLVLLSFGAVSSKAAGNPGPRHYEGRVTVFESGIEIVGR
jgi:hypothetical protein